MITRLIIVAVGFGLALLAALTPPNYTVGSRGETVQCNPLTQITEGRFPSEGYDSKTSEETIRAVLEATGVFDTTSGSRRLDDAVERYAQTAAVTCGELRQERITILVLIGMGMLSGLALTAANRTPPVSSAERAERDDQPMDGTSVPA